MTERPRRTGLAGRAARLRWALMHHGRRGLVRPLDAPVVRAEAGDDLTRVLLVGNGLVHGWGVSSHQLAPTGELARGVRTLTGRACEVVYVGDAAMSAATAADWVAGRAADGYDCAVVAIGSNDALALTPVAEWGDRLTALLDVLRDGLGPAAPIVVAGVPEVYVAARIRSLGPLAARHARRLDLATERVAASRPGVAFVPAGGLRGLAGGERVHDLYGRFATPIAVAVASLAGRGASGAEPERFERTHTAAVVDAARWQELPGLQRIVERAKAEFGADESAVTLLDGDRTWHVAHTGSAPASMPRSLSYCEAVVETGDPLVVEDARRSTRFADNAFLQLIHAPFYAGVPIRDGAGTPIGAFCLMGGSPRKAGSVDLERLRALAGEAEALVRAAAARPADVADGAAPR
ncbi:GAF domain-containing protein [Amnibacterium endophyticum]|uniref:GAF domain-containing protein n=1 Tax=Amnibacterium endophyticum TaxID=2109337 RepID=A0ABW4LAT7_9MICO